MYIQLIKKLCKLIIYFIWIFHRTETEEDLNFDPDVHDLANGLLYDLEIGNDIDALKKDSRVQHHLTHHIDSDDNSSESGFSEQDAKESSSTGSGSTNSCPTTSDVPPSNCDCSSDKQNGSNLGLESVNCNNKDNSSPVVDSGVSSSRLSEDKNNYPGGSPFSYQKPNTIKEDTTRLWNNLCVILVIILCMCYM